MEYLLAQTLSLVFYIITFVVYYRAQREYLGGKIAGAIKLIIIFLAIVFAADAIDYFMGYLFPARHDDILIVKILLRLIGNCVLFFGGLRFFATNAAPTYQPAFARPTPHAPDAGSEPKHAGPAPSASAPATMVIDANHDAMPTLGRYEVIEQIGRGAMGIVYKGRDPKLNRMTAIKTIRFTDDFDEDQVEKVRQQFYREAEVVAKLAHPNIITIYDVGEDLDLSYLAMEFLEGEGLEIFTAPDRLLPVDKCIDVIRQVCDALSYAHSHGIVHRDIKPANIILLKNGTVKVADFGIARVMASSRTRTGTVKGTPYYMSPEQTKGVKLTGQSDIFSLGVVFYQLLTGHLPFNGDNLASIMYQITTKEPIPPTDHSPTLNKATATILNRALAKELSSRYADANQMGGHLRLLAQKMAEARSRLRTK